MICILYIFVVKTDDDFHQPFQSLTRLINLNILEHNRMSSLIGVGGSHRHFQQQQRKDDDSFSEATIDMGMKNVIGVTLVLSGGQ